ncbi:His Kinase A (phospho-acceptor) domain-containing protein [Micromonospora sediminimaris]|uniref:histidine kinase n=2 Tax=Micromonospora sediminimaris TaxID=547162 RepID=A0A9W5XL43_9ACTN|nr:two-component sensor histidine kinase [Micromonospora sediminimaris]SFD41227.1 His Kinase A (phospho-acceptor) domain-containing protein [Micromonospora sediminimaris]
MTPWRRLRRPAPAGLSWMAAERIVVARARRRVGVLVGLAVTVLVTAVGVLAYGMLVRDQERQIKRELAYTASRSDPSGPPGCTWLFLLRDGEISGGTVPAPPGFPLATAMTTTASTGVPAETTITRNGTVYFVLTETRGEDVVQAIFDARYQLADRRHLLVALAVAELLGLVVAVASGCVVGRLAVAPLADSLARQRRFIADVSHELRTPIAQVHTRAQLLARRAGAAGIPVEYQSELNRLTGTTRRLGEVVNDLLLSARLAAAPGDRPAADPVDLATLAEAAVLAENDRAGEQGVALTLSRPDVPVPVAGVESALRRVISELLTNALTHTPAGGRIDVTVRLPAPDVAELIVADTGNGFDPADRIFDRFYSGAGPEKRHTGLGLALLREVVTGHGGSIDARSHPGRGARFAVRLPVGTSPRPAASTLASVSGDA